MNSKIISVLFTLIISILLFEFSDVDIVLQDYLFNFRLSQWLINRDDEVLKLLFYDGIKMLYILFTLLILSVLLLYRKKTIISGHKKGLIIVCLSLMFVPLAVGSLKAITNIPCPKNITHYGGYFPYVTLFKRYPPNFQQLNNIKCYPAGHASGGFALMSLFFLFKSKKNKVIALTSAITTGWVTGGYKMLIGDHFLSHTWITMVLAWLIILIIARFVNMDNKLTAVQSSS